MTIPAYLESENWVRNVFSAKAVGRGGVLHRAVRDVERYVGREAFAQEVLKRGFTLVENGDQFVIFCNRDPVRLIVDRDPPPLSERARPVFRRAAPEGAAPHR
ncbi:N-(5'-phosphoribosyl)anthranilate isomerase [Marivita sp. GX14005]|uniref:N-(5'-phosphoribosyl)anthranilate isomerase n=1 Tax=Marivita sp. GX14005 TaxID=2942276 RepID=UPI002018C85A|nr:N-(5'-phosphoribosyl)anthranilate isomerase [Marivita sp. GX14005]MCL3882852.1 N-(5'-phosphoribosyl)anthranilate isomerase [Marivita sp. GX14005]